jgi:peptidyl-prolyl cis-trans isomerase D
MATLQKIRNRAGLLVAVIIGMAIFAFVLQDLLTGGKTAFRRSKQVFAEIDGRSLQYNEYAARVDKLSEYYQLRVGKSSLDEKTMESIREQTWQDMVREYVTMSEYKELGISVSTDEMMDMVQGRNPHPIIQSLFSDPQTGILNRTFLVQFIRTMDQDPSGKQKTIWLYLENEILEDREFTKFNNLIKKGLFVTDLEVRNSAEEGSRRADIKYLAERFSSVPDTAVTLTESDIHKYYRDHEKDYLQEASRDIEYVVFDVAPSQEDDAAAWDWINKMKGEFESTDDPESLVNMDSDIPFDDMNYTYGSLPDTINDFMFSSKVGAVYGPYETESSYRLARLVKTDYLPDSVRARHILLQSDGSSDPRKLLNLADSLQTVLNNGGSWDLLARQFGTDATASQGGDLGWFTEGKMVKRFSDTCFYDTSGKVKQVQTQFGIHLVQVTARSPEVKKVKVAYLCRNIEPSSETYRLVYSRAVKFAGLNNTYEKFNEGIAAQNLTKRYASDLTETQRNITGLDNPRQLVRWAFDAHLHDVSNEVFEFGNKYVVAAVSGIREKGVAPLEQVKTEITLEVRKEKKAEKIIKDLESKMASANDLNALAKQTGLSVQTANNIRFSSVSLPGAGIEPRIIAAASVLPADQISKPIMGNNGVYVLVVTNINVSEQEPDLQVLRSRLTTVKEAQANYEAYNALRDAANIKDNRARFF